MIDRDAAARIGYPLDPVLELAEEHPMLPDEQIGNSAVQPILQKYFRSRIAQIKIISAAVLSPKGALAIVTDAGRDAMDADVPLTNGM